MRLNQSADWTGNGRFDGGIDLTAEDSGVISYRTVGTGWNALTLEAWINVDHMIEGVQPIISRYEWFERAAFYFCIYGNGALAGGVYTTAGQDESPQVVSGEGLLQAGQWYYLALTWASGEELTLWIDGEPVAVVDCPGGVIRDSFDSLTIGYQWNNDVYPDDYFWGYMDEIRISDCCRVIQRLPSGQIQDLIDLIDGMVNDGELNGNQAYFLLRSLNGALYWAERENCRYVISYLNDLLRRVATLVWWGVLSPAEGQHFVDAINDILDCIEDCHGDATLEGLLAAIEKELPDVFSLSAAYPNPFNSMTTISFTLPFEMQTSLTVYDVSGRQVATLVDGVQQMGVHSAAFNADNLTTGMYFVVLNAGGKVLTQKVMLVR